VRLGQVVGNYNYLSSGARSSFINGETLHTTL
jgi:hypothetical protein